MFACRNDDPDLNLGEWRINSDGLAGIDTSGRIRCTA
jgi:hypothetical protein